MKIIVLGGAGKMGSIAVQDLALNEAVDQVVIADREVGTAQTVAETIGSPKVEVQTVDLMDHDRLVGALRGADACVNATVYYTNLRVMEACLEAGVHYTDLGGLFHTTRKQLELYDRFAEAGISAVLGMGSAPGVPNIQARYAADRLDTIEYIRIYDGVRPPAPGDMTFTYAVPTIVDEMTLSPMVFRDGEFIECEPLTEFEDYGFSGTLGRLPMHLSLHSEVATLPVTYADKGVRECFFKINYWGMSIETVKKVRVLVEFGFDSREPVVVGDQTVTPRDVMIAMMGGYVPPITDFLAPPTNKPPDWAKEIVTEVKGTRGGKTVVYRMGTMTLKGALTTGVVPARGAVWQAAGRVEPGVVPPELAFDPEPFLKELEARDIYTQVGVTESL
jgi:lysine 6-dehydrogenase